MIDIDNDLLSKLATNFKAVSEHPVEILTLADNGFLRTINTDRTKAEKRVITCIKETYKGLKQVLELPPKTFINSDLDFETYVLITCRLSQWASAENPSGYSCAEKYDLVQKMREYTQHSEQFLVAEQIKKTAEKTVKANSFKELFAREEGKKPEGKLNVLVIMTDEEKILSGYESKDVKDFYNDLPGEKALRKDGITFTDHYTASTACSPSRVVLISGHFSELTGVTSTDLGDTTLAKIRDMPEEVPTYASYLKIAGYDTVYKGKNHTSHDDLLTKNKRGETVTKVSKPVNQPPDQKVVEEYKKADLLKKYALHGWIGPDMHGSSPHDTAYNRDKDLANQMKEFLMERDKAKISTPFLAILSLVGPHDIVLYPFYWIHLVLKYGFTFLSDEVKNLKINLPPKMGDGLDDRPRIQKEYRKQFAIMFTENLVNGSYSGPGKKFNPFTFLYHRMYLFFKQAVDQEVLGVYQTLQKTSFFEDTIVIFTSDHGSFMTEKIGKWSGVDEEALRIPLIISNPRFKNKGKTYSELSAHDSLAPTIVKLAGLNEEELLQKLKHTHSEAHPFVGKPLGDPFLPTGLDNERVQILDRLLFKTSDLIFNVSDNPETNDVRSILQGWYNIPKPLTRKIDGLYGNNHIHMVVARLKIDGEIYRYKYAAYTPDPKKMKNPDQPEESELEEEFYPHEVPYERKNFSQDQVLSSRDQLALDKMRQLLALLKKQKLIKPNNPEILTRPNKNKVKVTSIKPGYDFLFLLLTPPALTLLLLGTLIYKQRHNIVKSAPAVALLVGTFGLYRQYQKGKAKEIELVELEENKSPMMK